MKSAKLQKFHNCPDGSGRVILRHVASGIRFVSIPGGRFQMGLSGREEEQARSICDPPPISIDEMRPVQTLDVRPFLVSETPVLLGQLGDKKSDAREDLMPAIVTYGEATGFAERFGFRLPTEAEWEYSCRAGGVDLFVWGAHVPTDGELSRWLSWDLGDLTGVPRNGFGLSGLFFGEWCTDRFRKNLSVGSEETDSQVVKGGGAYFWPWQDNEWVWCLPAMRMPSDASDSPEYAFRLVADPGLVTIE